MYQLCFIYMLNYPAVYTLSKERERHKPHMAKRGNTKTLPQWAHFARQKVNEEETAADSKSNGTNTGCIRATYMVLSGKGCWIFKKFFLD